jgi:integrase
MRRRANGEGGIYKRSDGLWTAQISLGWKPGGKRVRKSVYGRTQAEVRDKLRAVLRDKADGAVIRTDGRITVADYLSRWMQAIAPSVRVRTRAIYQGQIDRHILPDLGGLRLTDLTPDGLQLFFNRKGEKLSPQSVINLRSMLRAALNQAIEWGYLTKNPVSKTKPPKREHRQMHVLSQEQARQLLHAAEGDRLYALYSVALALGLRLGEALALHWTDIDFEGNRLHVRHTLVRDGKELVRGDPKTAGSSRSILMPAVLGGTLRTHQKNQHALGIVTPFVFSTSTGKPIDPRSVSRTFKRLKKRSGLPAGLRFHDLRHSSATLLLARGVNVKVIAELLGHSNVNLLLTVYSHVLPQMRDEAAAVMNGVLGG